MDDKIKLFIIFYLQPHKLVQIESIKNTINKGNRIVFHFLRSTEQFHINNKKEFIIKIWKRWEN